jgi:hypothetical protein
LTPPTAAQVQGHQLDVCVPKSFPQVVECLGIERDAVNGERERSIWQSEAPGVHVLAPDDDVELLSQSRQLSPVIRRFPIRTH